MRRLPLVVLILAATIAACDRGKTPPQQAQPQVQQPAGDPQALAPSHGEASANAAAGVRWTPPSRWGMHPPRQMRVATYMIPSPAGEADGGECAVFFFGTGQGGDTEANIGRWASQFKENPKPERSSREVNGLSVTIVKLAGTYLAPSGPMMESSGSFADYRLLGAIVDAPEGPVFFKLTGPAKTVAGAEKEFDDMVASIVKQ